MIPLRRLLLSLFLLGYTSLITAQDPVTTNVQPRPSIAATTIESSPSIDGEVLTDEVWKAIEPFGNM